MSDELYRCEVQREVSVYRWWNVVILMQQKRNAEERLAAAVRSDGESKMYAGGSSDVLACEEEMSARAQET